MGFLFGWGTDILLPARLRRPLWTVVRMSCLGGNPDVVVCVMVIEFGVAEVTTVGVGSVVVVAVVIMV